MTTRETRAQELIQYEKPYRIQGTIAGMDEAGRGPLAGPVVAACVIMPETPLLTWVDDSKKLSESRREKVFDEVMHCAIAVGVGQIEPQEIDEINILQATKKAMEIAASEIVADLFLVDAVSGLHVPGELIPIIHGDALSYSIAAASIIAKVTRDRLMIRMDQCYPGYGFARNKGYGTREHIEALKKLGPCPIHRKTFIGNFI